MERAATISSCLLYLAAAASAQETLVDEDVVAPETGGSFWSQFKDQRDGQFDVTALLANGGFIPVPIIITEPAIGLGGGAALLFVHNRKGESLVAKRDGARRAPPSMSAVFGAGTENGTWIAGGFHRGIWKDDTVRYTGAVLKGTINLDFYVGQESFAYGLDTAFLYQDIKFRTGETDLFLGLSYRVANTEADFRDAPPQSTPATDQTDAGLGFAAQWDTRDNQFSPTSGQEALVEAIFWDDAVGSDSTFTNLEGRMKSYHPVFDEHVLGVRFNAKTASSGAPFYLRPSVQLRGIPAMRYQGDTALSAEAEFRYVLDARWSLLAFGGAGASWNETLPNSDAVFAGGAGFRYLMARPLGISMGLDLAVGPEDTVLYVAFGSGL